MNGTRPTTSSATSYIAYFVKEAKKEGTVDQLRVMLEGVGGEEAMRLAMKASHEQPPPP
jgi:hypothetical protein